MSTDTDTVHRVFNELLSQWRKQGRKLGWEELTEAYKLAREVDAHIRLDEDDDR